MLRRASCLIYRKTLITRSIHLQLPYLRISCSSISTKTSKRQNIYRFPNDENRQITVRYPLYFCCKFYSTTRNVRSMKEQRSVAVSPDSDIDKKGIKSKIKSTDVKRLLSLAGPEKWRLAGGVSLLLISSGVTMSVPFFMGHIIDIVNAAATNADAIEKLQKICAVLGAVFISGATANFGRVYLMQISGQRIIKQIRDSLFSSVMTQEMAFFDKTKTGEIINRLSADTALVGQSVTQNISDGLRSTIQAIGAVGMMFYVSPKLTLVALSIVPPIAIVSIIYGRYVRSITKNVQDSLADATQVAEERISNIRSVRAFAHEPEEMKSYRQRIEHVLNLSYKEALARGLFWASTGLSGNLIMLSVFYNGGLQMQEAQMTVGDLSAFLLYAAYIGVAMGGLSSFYTEMMRGLGASGRLWELTDRQPSIPLFTEHIHSSQHGIKGDIIFNDISFTYPSRPDVQLFKELSLTAPSGQVTAVVGPSGSGKSTLTSLLLRFYDPNQGCIMINGNNISNMSPSWLRRHIGTVSQEPVLFSCSVAENIAYGAFDPDSVTTEDITEAAKKANAFNFVNNFPDGFDTLVGERGLMLSGGQRQRIAIARAILRNPEILVLDEATSALDAESEYLVQEALERLMVGRTVITIAHRLSTIKNANQIAVLDNGHVVELGSYSHLMNIENGLFKKLVERQTLVNH
ncbi:ATP-binding cassette sub-family B member 10, mitochondrial-like [Tubulanus polymorphus]|uniref:ATP-binding cassette sub-family B member 10, mitochondrial-like n=1 Tax=Tubulanus polymorphus TaxID=672921 RepID=UPI003DA68EB6